MSEEASGQPPEQGWASPGYSPPPAGTTPPTWGPPPAGQPPAWVQHPAQRPAQPPPWMQPPTGRPLAPQPPAPQSPSAQQPAPGQPRIEPIPGTDFGLAYFSVPPTVSGQAVGSMVAGILSVVVAFIVGCFGVAGAQAGWGPIVAGAFAVLAVMSGLAAMGLGWFSTRQIARAARRLAGRGMAVAGISCGAVGLGLTVVALVLSLAI